jgi:hypothetical protein
MVSNHQHYSTSVGPTEVDALFRPGQQQTVGVSASDQNDPVDAYDHTAPVVVPAREILPSMESACGLVQEILEQLVEKDAPPVNDRNTAFQPGRTTTKTTTVEPLGSSTSRQSSTPLCSPQRHVQQFRSTSRNQHPRHGDGPDDRGGGSRQSSPTELLAGASSFDTDVSSLAPSTFFQDFLNTTDHPVSDSHPAARWKAHYRQTGASERKLGHSSLVALCAWTLEQVQGKEELTPAVPLQIETDMLLTGQFSSSPMVTPLSPTKQGQHKSSHETSPSKRSKLLFWKKKQNTANASSQSGSFPATETSWEEEKKEDFPEPPQPKRLQMFGSEYARHLSTSALAPVQNNHQTRTSRRNGNQSSNSRGRSSKAHQRQPLNLEDAEPEILSGAVIDIVVTVGDDLPPLGYHRISQTATGQPFLLQHSKKKAVYINVKKEPVWDKAAQRPCVTALAIIFPDRQEFVPPGFCIVRQCKAAAKQEGNTKNKQELDSAADLNHGSGEERVYLCFRRSREGNPLTGILPLRPDHAEAIPEGYTVLEKTPRNFLANMNRSSGPPIFLAYRQRLANLEPLRPLALVLSVHQLIDPTSQASVFEDETGSSVEMPSHRLQAYYCTGGTVVPADVGRFHIMDRSTHSLLSTSSVANRLRLIEKSRARATNKPVPRTTTSASTEEQDSAGHYASSSSNNNNMYSNNRPRADSIGASSVGDLDSVGSASKGFHDNNGSFATMDQASFASLDGDSLDVSIVMLSALLGGSRGGVGGIHYAIFGGEDAELEKCLDALRFIPNVDTATRGVHKLQATLRLQIRAALLTPILTACYTRHGGAALVAVEGLTSLLKEKFFADDVDLSDESDNESSNRLTLLDLAIQSVCDVATASSQEITFGSCVEFVEHAVRFAQGQLNTRTIGYVSRFYLFVFYFGVSIPTTSSVWPSPGKEEDIPMLFDPRILGGSRGYLPGGAPQSAALALKELVSLSIVRLGKISVNDSVILARGGSGPQGLGRLGVVDQLLSSLVDDAIDHVEIANFTQLALQQVQRSGGSELFWHDMIHSCGSGLFGNDKKLGEEGKDIYIMIFAVMANLVKVSSGKMRTNVRTSELLPRDEASKLLSLELLLHFLEFWSDEQEAVNGIATVKSSGSARSNHTLAFSIRRMVVPCLLSNTQAALEDHKVFSRVIRIISELWSSPVYRRHCKAELGILIEHFAIRMLQLGPQLITSKKVDLDSEQATLSLLSQQIELIKEIKNWFSDDPKDVIELYLNYDTDISSQISGPIQLLPGTQFKLFQRLCSGLSNIAEQCGELIGEQIRENQSKVMSQSEGVGGGLSELLASMEDINGDAVDKTAMRESARLLRKTSLEAISQIVKALAISAAAATGSEFTSLLLSWTPPDSPIAYQRTSSSSSLRSNHEEGEHNGSTFIGGKPCKNGVGGDEILKFWRGAIAEEQKQRVSDSSPSSEESLITALDIAERKSLKKAVEYLIACNSLTPAPRDVATFLRIHKEQLDPADLGNYITEYGNGGAETEYWDSIRHNYVRAISFGGMNVEEGLRHFLTNCGFRLPGEAQKIDRIMNTFAQCYFEDNAGDTHRCPFKEEDTVYVLSFAIIMLNTDLHKTGQGVRKSKKKMSRVEFTNNLRGVAQGEDINREYLCTIYDSIEADPIAMHGGDVGDSATADRHKTLHGMLNNVRTADALLRGLAVHDFKFASIEDFTTSLEYTDQDALSDLTRSCVAKTWHQWYGVVNTGLETAHLDPQGMEPSVDILMYALSVTVCLDMPTERAAFMSQLGRLKAFEERRQGRWVTSPDQESFHEDDWYLELEQACAGTPERKMWALRKIRKWMGSLQSALQVDVQNKVEMTKAVSKLKDGDFLLHDPGRAFLRDGDLVKKSGRTGRLTTYRFFLFSDVLLYANREVDGRYTVHEELPLHLMKVVDWFPPSLKNGDLSFEVHHPRKKFQVVCSSRDERKSWVQDIRSAIKQEIVRKMKVEAARLAAYTHG